MQKNFQSDSIVSDDQLLESLLKQFNNNDNNHNNHNNHNNLNSLQDHLLLLSPSSTNSISISTTSLSPSQIQLQLKQQQQQQSINQYYHPIPSPDASVGFKPSIDHHFSTSLPARNPPYCSIDHQNLVLTEKRRKRRESHNAVERRRRDNINDRISELASLIPNCVLETVVTPTESGMVLVNEPAIDSTQNSKPNKGIILAKSVDYIKQLKDLLELQIQRNRELEAELNQIKSKLNSDPISIRSVEQNNQELGTTTMIIKEEEEPIEIKMNDPTCSTHLHRLDLLHTSSSSSSSSFEHPNFSLDRFDNLYHYLQ